MVSILYAKLRNLVIIFNFLYTCRCLSSIMYCYELKPDYVKCSNKIWNESRLKSLIPKELPAVADLQKRTWYWNQYQLNTNTDQVYHLFIKISRYLSCLD